MKKIIFVVTLGVGCFLGGYAASIQSHGDWVIYRSSPITCTALDVDVPGGAVIGEWPLIGTKCHMSHFIWEQTVDGPVKFFTHLKKVAYAKIS